MRINLLVRTVIAGACATALVAPALTSPATARPAEHARAATPTITAKVTKQGVSLKGVEGLHAGRAKLVVKGKGDTTVTFGTLKAGYSMDAFSKDLALGFGKNNSKAIKRIYAKADAIGGLAAGDTGTIVFPHPGQYFAFTVRTEDQRSRAASTSGRRGRPRHRTSTARSSRRTDPGGAASASLPAQGTLLFKNAATTPVLHFMALQHVAEGTTVDQVLERTAERPGPGPRLGAVRRRSTRTWSRRTAP